MVIARQQNATAEANPSVTKFNKKQIDLKMKEVQEFAANNAAGLYQLNLHVLGLNYSSTEAEIIKAYCVVISYCNSLTNNKVRHTEFSGKEHTVVRYGTQLMSSTTHTVVTYVVM